MRRSTILWKTLLENRGGRALKCHKKTTYYELNQPAASGSNCLQLKELQIRYKRPERPHLVPKTILCHRGVFHNFNRAYPVVLEDGISLLHWTSFGGVAQLARATVS